jgi:hypothetical protein
MVDAAPGTPGIQPHVTLDPATLPPAAQKLRAPLEDQLSSAVQVATERVSAGYRGESAEEVRRQLLATTRELLHPDIGAAFQPDRAEFGRIADRIVAERSAR